MLPGSKNGFGEAPVATQFCWKHLSTPPWGRQIPYRCKNKNKNDVHTVACLCVPTSMQIVTNSAPLWRENNCTGLKKGCCKTIPQQFDISISMLYIPMFCSLSVLSLCIIIKLCEKNVLTNNDAMSNELTPGSESNVLFMMMKCIVLSLWTM